jgi:hypothetical protein
MAMAVILKLRFMFMLPLIEPVGELTARPMPFVRRDLSNEINPAKSMNCDVRQSYRRASRASMCRGTGPCGEPT